MKIIISGDLYISPHYGGKKLISGSVERIFTESDMNIVNLETPITSNNKKNRISKTGPHLYTHEETMIPYLKQINTDMVTLSNNHIMDYGEAGLLETLNTLQTNRIKYVGVGENINEASKPQTIKSKDVKIAILNYTYNEWSTAEISKAGANPLDVIDNVKQIKSAKDSHDKVILIIHGGHEYYHLPSPQIVKQYRFYVDNGADAIIGHHTHCIGGYEIYNNAPIIYSLGNFIFTIPSPKEEWYTGLLAELYIERNTPILFKLHPVRQDRNNFSTRLMINKDKYEVLQNIKQINGIISDEKELHAKWDAFLYKRSKLYLSLISPHNALKNRYLRAIINKIGIMRFVINKRYSMFLLNLIRCESHLDALKCILKRNIENR